MQSVPEDYPITGVCIVSDPTKVPPGYHVICRSYDKNEDCDLWKDSFFRSKVTRYLCFTRQYPLDNGKLNNVLANIVINNEKDLPPPGYSLMDFTIDTREKATRKRQICVQMLPRATTQDAISEIILLSKTRRAPPGYTFVGELNGIMICYKISGVPPEKPNGVIETNTIQRSAVPPTFTPQSSIDNRPYGAWNPIPPPRFKRQENSSNLGAGNNPPVGPGQCPATTGCQQASWGYDHSSYPVDPSFYFSRDSHTLRKQDSLVNPSSSLHGVPFQLSSHFHQGNDKKNQRYPEIQFRSFVDIDNEYNYSFRTEQSALQDS